MELFGIGVVIKQSMAILGPIINLLIVMLGITSMVFARLLRECA